MHVPVSPATRPPAARRAAPLLAAVQIVLGIAALFGGYGLLADAEGLGMREAWLDGSPFPDYTVPGLVLLVAIGGGMLVSGALAAAGHRWAHRSALVMGAGLALWLVIETAIIGMQAWEQVVLLVVCGAVAAYLLRDGFTRRPRPAAGGPGARTGAG